MDGIFLSLNGSNLLINSIRRLMTGMFRLMNGELIRGIFLFINGLLGQPVLKLAFKQPRNARRTSLSAVRILPF